MIRRATDLIHQYEARIAKLQVWVNASMGLLFLLIDHGRVPFLHEIADDFDARMLDYQGAADVQVTTAVAMSPEQKERLRAAIGRKLGKTIRITEHIDRSILGGVIVQYGDTRIDNSVKFRLDALKAKLS